MPYDDPTTLHYHLGDPGLYGNAAVGGPRRAPITRIERTLYLYLISFRSFLRDQAWRNAAKNRLPKWPTNLDSDRSQTLVVNLPRNPNVDDTSSKFASPKQTTSSYLTSSSPLTAGPRVTIRAAARYAPPSDPSHHENSSDSESDPTASAGRKRGFSQVTSSPPAQRSASQETLGGGLARSRRLPSPPACPRIGYSRLSRGNQFGPNLLPPRRGKDPSYAFNGLGW